MCASLCLARKNYFPPFDQVSKVDMNNSSGKILQLKVAKNDEKCFHSSNNNNLPLPVLYASSL